MLDKFRYTISERLYMYYPSKSTKYSSAIVFKDYFLSYRKNSLLSVLDKKVNIKEVDN